MGEHIRGARRFASLTPCPEVGRGEFLAIVLAVPGEAFGCFCAAQAEHHPPPPLLGRRLEVLRVDLIGDNLNDLTMIEWAGRGVAMGNAEDAVKDIADEVTSTNVDFGVARILEELV